jgi:hypothetical protein
LWETNAFATSRQLFSWRGSPDKARSEQDFTADESDLLEGRWIVRRLDSCDSLEELKVRLSDSLVDCILFKLPSLGLNLPSHLMELGSWSLRACWAIFIGQNFIKLPDQFFVLLSVVTIKRDREIET